MKRKRKLSISSILLLIVVLTAATFSIINLPSIEIKELTYTEFEEMVEEGKVESVSMNPQNPNELMEVTLKDNEEIVLVPNPQSDQFKENMLKEGVEVNVETPSVFGGFIVQILIMVGIFYLVFSLISKKQMGNFAKKDKEMIQNAMNSKKRVAKFSDVAGIDDAKDELWEVVTYLKNPKQFAEVGARPPKGVLLYGPSGTGKTLVARATAGEAGVPFFSISGSDFIEKFVGVGASRVRELFARARKVAPAIIYIDEIDSLAKDRSRMSNDESNQTLNQLLSEMDGFSDNSGIIVLASTNRKDSLDPAVLRPGRFDKHIEVGLPDLEGREQILKIHSRNKKLGNDVNLERLAKQTVGFSGAQLEQLMNESALMSLRRNHSYITWEDTQDAFEVILVGPKKKRSNWSEREQKVVAYHEAGHALVTHLLAKEPIERVTVNPAGRAGGYVMRTPKDYMLKTEKEFYHDICIAMAGREAEAIIFGRENVTNGAQQDFRQASQTALQMVFAYGMSDLGALAIPSLDDNMWFRLSDDLKNKAYEEMGKIMKEAEEETRKFLLEHKDMLHRLAIHLMKVGTIDGEVIDDVIHGRLEETPQHHSTHSESKGKIVELDLEAKTSAITNNIHLE